MKTETLRAVLTLTRYTAKGKDETVSFHEDGAVAIRIGQTFAEQGGKRRARIVLLSEEGAPGGQEVSATLTMRPMTPRQRALASAAGAS